MAQRLAQNWDIGWKSPSTGREYGERTGESTSAEVETVICVGGPTVSCICEMPRSLDSNELKRTGARTESEGRNMKEMDRSGEGAEGDGERRDPVGRAKEAIVSARQKASRSIDVMTGADIRRFDEFTDATTRVVVGLHQDLSELREQVARHQRVLDDDRRTNLTPVIAVGGIAAVALLLSIVALVIGLS